jgi:WXXGXW repeat (2 copies)
MKFMNGPRVSGGLFAVGVLAAGLIFHPGFVLGQVQVQQGPPLVDGQDDGPDPADQNMAPVDGGGQPGMMNESQPPASQYGQPQPGVQGGAPIERRAPSGSPQPGNDQGGGQVYVQPGQGYDANNQVYDANAAELGTQLNADANAGQPVMETDQAPPQLLEYDQPEAPAPDNMWTPGYWAWGSEGYYWVPGVWVAAPYPGALWTPGYWYFYGGRYRFHHGYWGLYVGFYGGINYGYGYYGVGYHGGYWNGPHFFYNVSVTRVNVTRVSYVYRHPQVIAVEPSRVSFNGGRGGVIAQPRPAELAALRTARAPAMSEQIQVREAAARNPQQFYERNHGNPQVMAAPKPVAADRGISRPEPIRTASPGPQNVYQGQGGGRPNEVRTPAQPSNPPQPQQPRAQTYSQQQGQGRPEGTPYVQQGRPNGQPEGPPRQYPHSEQRQQQGGQPHSQQKQPEGKPR